MRPEKGTYPDYFETYIQLTVQNDVTEALTANEEESLRFLESMPEDLGNYAYEPGKWTVKQVLNHIIDTERIFAYRCLRFARRDETQPLSFDQDSYALNSGVENRTVADMIGEFKSVREATLSLFRSFTPEVLQRTGQTKAGKASVNALGFTICGHCTHHLNVIKDRYLTAEG